MTTKTLTVRIPVPVYSNLCQEAGELGVPLASHVRRLLERESEMHHIEQLHQEILAKVAALGPAAATEAPAELLHLARAIAAHLNPQLVAQVQAKLAAKPGVRP